MSAAYAKIIMCLQFQANVPYTILSKDSETLEKSLCTRTRMKISIFIPVILGPLGGTSL